MQAIIDVGSNSIKLCVYHVKNGEFSLLFKQKTTAGIAGYIENDVLTDEGIRRAAEAIIYFKTLLGRLKVNKIAVFATASLRNIKNPNCAKEALCQLTGLNIDVISGSEEAYLSYLGAALNTKIYKGAFIDIGGASTELALLLKNKPEKLISFPIGSLSLYRACDILLIPGKEDRAVLQNAVKSALDLSFFPKCPAAVFIGGTARTLKKAAKKLNLFNNTQESISLSSLKALLNMLFADKKQASELILKISPERIHTFIPGLMIMEHICNSLNADNLIISDYGAREGYLCQKIIKA